MDFLMKLTADYLMIPIVLIGGYALVFKIPKKTRWEAYSRILVAGLTTYLFAKLIGYLYQPAVLRPFELNHVNPGASFLNNPGFPSDHILFATAITCAVWFETKQKALTLILIGLTFIVAIGRVWAQVHTPLDVIGGALIGMMGSVWYINK